MQTADIRATSTHVPNTPNAASPGFPDCFSPKTVWGFERGHAKSINPDGAAVRRVPGRDVLGLKINVGDAELDDFDARSRIEDHRVPKYRNFATVYALRI